VNQKKFDAYENYAGADFPEAAKKLIPGEDQAAEHNKDDRFVWWKFFLNFESALVN
jgi:hypothetical protein